jgi:hypothetical protein
MVYLSIYLFSVDLKIKTVYSQQETAANDVVPELLQLSDFKRSSSYNVTLIVKFTKISSFAL